MKNHAQPEELVVEDIDTFETHFRGEIQGLQPSVMMVGSSRRLNGIGRINGLGQETVKPTPTFTPPAEKPVVTTLEGVAIGGGIVLTILGVMLNNVFGGIMAATGTSTVVVGGWSALSRKYGG